jgi:hypothetical protein
MKKLLALLLLSHFVAGEEEVELYCNNTTIGVFVYITLDYVNKTLITDFKDPKTEPGLFENIEINDKQIVAVKKFDNKYKGVLIYTLDRVTGQLNQVSTRKVKWERFNPSRIETDFNCSVLTRSF